MTHHPDNMRPVTIRDIVALRRRDDGISDRAIMEYAMYLGNNTFADFVRAAKECARKTKTQADEDAMLARALITIFVPKPEVVVPLLFPNHEDTGGDSDDAYITFIGRGADERWIGPGR